MRTLMILGVVMFLGSIALIGSNFHEFRIDRYGNVVKMRIESLPKSCIGAKIRYDVSYSYNGKIYNKATRGSFCEDHYIGELVEMKYLEGYKTILRPNESSVMNLAGFGALGILGLSISIVQWRKIRRFRDIDSNPNSLRRRS